VSRALALALALCAASSLASGASAAQPLESALVARTSSASALTAARASEPRAAEVGSRALDLEIQVPKNEGWVTDLTGTLSAAQKSELSTLMESYKRGTTHEIAVLIVPSLNGASLENYALEVGRQWGMGTKEKNNAALLLVVKNERKIRIEVARGLEGSLTDSISGRIIRDVIAPNFKRGQFFEGVKAGVVAMHEAIGGNYGALPRGQSVAVDPGLLGLIGCLVPILFFVFIVLAIIARVRRGSGAQRRSRWTRGWGGPFIGPFGGGSWGGGGGGHSSGGGFGGFSGFGGGGGFSGGGSSGGW
jgi:uncharacterized protein